MSLTNGYEEESGPRLGSRISVLGSKINSERGDGQIHIKKSVHRLWRLSTLVVDCLSLGSCVRQVRRQDYLSWRFCWYGLDAVGKNHPIRSSCRRSRCVCCMAGGFRTAISLGDISRCALYVLWHHQLYLGTAAPIPGPSGTDSRRNVSGGCLSRWCPDFRPTASNFYADIARNSWLVVPAQPVDATPSNQLIRQYFP